MELIEQYLGLLEEIVTFNDYENKSELAKYNKKFDKARKIAVQIENEFPQFKTDFCELIYNQNAQIRLLVAHHILEVPVRENKYKKLALETIKNKAKSPDGIGEKLWLKDWYKKHPLDRF